nr:fructose-specific PTS transporter subunit EIIC [uncultured Blautia sp.]
MRITDLLDKKSISLTAAPDSKQEALDEAIELIIKGGKIRDREAYRAQVYHREEEGSTGIGRGLAVPHGKCDAVVEPALAAMVIPQGVEFDALDQKPVQLLFLIAAPDTKENIHLKLLSRLSALLMDKAFAEQLKKASDTEEFLRLIDEAEERNQSRKKAAKPMQIQEKKKKILAVTSCPTGIAHTYMAEEGLEKAAEGKHCMIKVETRGAEGTKNLLTKEEIQEADGIIVAADIKVPMERFIGKKVLICQVSDGISKAEQLIDQILEGEIPVFEGEDTAGKPTGKAWHRVYMHLMNGISHMLPFVVGGGLLVALAFMIDSFCVDVPALSEEVRAKFGSITPFAAGIKGIGDAALGLMLPVLAGYIAFSIADRPGLAPGFVGGVIASYGKSGFMGALAAGFLAGYLMRAAKRLTVRSIPVLQRIAPVLLYPFGGILMMGLLMKLLVEPPVGAINIALHAALNGMGDSSKILLGIIVASMMATDMGGPCNKAAYVFGTASIAAGDYDIMAAVMLGGMVSPCAIALSTILFPANFTKDERKSAPMNFIMGLSFVTEGAIPFAAAHPFQVIPACMAGAGVSGALSMMFGCTMMAPNGGIFVFPVAEHSMLYFVALTAGTIVGAVLLGILKKPVRESVE